MTKCKGCGIPLQSSNENNLGYTPDIKNKLCKRCFKLKNYNILIDKGLSINNDKLIEKINKKNIFVFFLTDFINLDSNVIQYYKKITSKKVLVLTKSDIIPKNIKYNKLIDNIKDVYDIKESILFTSSSKKLNIKAIEKYIKEYKKCIFIGFTNAGKSSLINTMLGTDITVSSKENTTQEIIKLDGDDFTIYDAPGLIDEVNRENVFKGRINPRTYQFSSKQYLLINGIKLNILNNSNFTIYVDNSVNVERRKEIDSVKCDIKVPKNSDVIIKGLVFIKFKDETFISLSTKDYEIRKSIIGGTNE